MAKYLPERRFHTLGFTWSLNPGPWNAKEHTLILAAYWGSSYTAYGLGPLSAMELYYNKTVAPQWAILFLATTQLMGYGFAGLYRDILVRPPEMFYPGILPTVALFNAMHKTPSGMVKSLKFFCVVAIAAFVYQMLPSLFWPMLSSLPLLCYMVPKYWKVFIMGSGTYGFGLLDLSLDWNVASFFSPLYIPLWANANRIFGAAMACWILYPLLYFTDTLGAKTFAPMSSKTWHVTGAEYNISAILTPTFELNRTAMESHFLPRWSPSYVMHFFWGFASSTAVLAYALLFHGRSSWDKIRRARKNHTAHYDDPYLKSVAHILTVPHWWYIALLLACLLLSIVQLQGGEMQLPWWGMILITAISALFTFPSGILFGFANIQIGMDYIAEILSGLLFPGKPIAVLTCTVYGRQILEQCLNMVSDIKLGFYMKVPERALFVAQIYGTIVGPFVNWACMRLIIDKHGPDLKGEIPSIPTTWNALKTRDFYSMSVLWGILGPKALFGADSPYRWIGYGFLVGPLAVALIWFIHLYRPQWKVAEMVNPVIILNGAAMFPVYPTNNLTTSALVAVFFMGYVYRYHPVWFREYNYFLGAGLDCGAQLVQMLAIFMVDLLSFTMPAWWGNNAVAVDRCFPPSDLPAHIIN